MSDAGAIPGAAAEPRRFLLIQLYHLGDVLLATPAIRQLRQRYPSARIDFLADATGVELLRGNPHLDRVIPWRRGARAFIGLARRLRAARYDAVVDFLSKPSTAWLVAASRAPMRVGVQGRGPRNAVYTRLFPRELGPLYMPRQKLRLLQPLGVEPDASDVGLEIFPDDADREHAAALFERLGFSAGARVAAVSPVARHAFKRWPVERWADVIRGLRDAGLAVLLTHGPGEHVQAAEVTERLDGADVPVYAAGSVRRLAAVYERCALWLGNDGGAKHIAVAAGLPTVTVSRWSIGAVWSDPHPGSGQTSLERAPPQGCDLRCKDCPHLACLHEVTPDAVLAAARRALGSADAPRLAVPSADA